MTKINNSEKESLLEAKRKWESDIQMYKKFLKGNIKTFESKYGAEEYITLAQNRLEAIDCKLKRLQ